MKQSGVKFRIATDADAVRVAEVYLASRQTFVACAPLAHSDEAVLVWIRDILIPTGRVTVAQENSKIIGLMAVSVHQKAAWIDQMYLHPEAVGRGIGTLLLHRAKAKLGSPIRLYTFQANHDAIRFYERHGFKPIGYGDGSDNEEGCPDVLYEWRE
jgi:ribosomal protein S18 acetylase RimI-like enzyme